MFTTDEMFSKVTNPDSVTFPRKAAWELVFSEAGMTSGAFQRFVDEWFCESSDFVEEVVEKTPCNGVCRSRTYRHSEFCESPTKTLKGWNVNFEGVYKGFVKIA